MKRIFSFLFSAAAIVAWCTPGFAAAETVTSTGAGSAHNSEATGQGAGYFMQDVGAAYTLDVINGFQNINTGNLGGPFTNSAVDTDTASYANILFDAGDNSNVYGTIGASKQFLNITLTGNASVNFYGTVNTTTMDVGTGTASFLSGTMTNVVSGGATFTGAIGTGTIDLAANTGFTGAITTLNSGAGTLVLNNNTSVTGAVTGIGAITLPGTIVDTVSPTITGQVSAQTFNLGVNRLNVSGALTTGTSGAINTSLASTSLYGNIAATGNSALGTGLTVNVTPLQLVDIPAGTKFYLVTAPSGNAPTGLTVTDPANSSYTFTVAALAGQLTITSQTDIPATVLPPGVAPIVPVILIPNPSPVITNVQNSILALSTAEAISAIAQLGPSTPSLVAPQVTFQGAREFQNLWESHLEMCSQAGSADEASCKGTSPSNGVWVKGFGYFGSQADQKGYSGYDATIFGTMVAYDVPIIDENTRAGVGLGYSHTTIDGSTYNNNTEIDTFQPTVYIGHDQGPWFVHGSESFGFNEYDGRRNIVFPGVDYTAKSEYNGEDYTTFVNSGYNFSAPLQSTVTPIVSLQYSRVNMDSYTEKGAGDLDLHAKPQGYDFLESGLGAKVERDFSYHNLTFVPEIHVEWLHDFLNPTMGQNARFTAAGEPSFYVTGLKTDPDTLHAGASLTLLSCTCSKTKLSLEAGYDFYWRNDGYIANQVTMRLTARF